MFSLGFKNILLPNPDGAEPVESIWVLPIGLGIVILMPAAILYYFFYSNYDENDMDESKFGIPLYITMVWANMLLIISTEVERSTIVSTLECPSQHRHALRLFFLPDSNSSFQDLDQAVAAAAGATTCLTRLCSVCFDQYRRWRSRQERRSLLNIDANMEEQPAYTDEEEGPPEAFVDHDNSQDIELSTISPLPQPRALVQSNPDALMSGALATEREEEEEPDAPLPLAATPIIN